MFAGIASSLKEVDVRVLALHKDEAKRWNTALQQKELVVTFRCEGENTSSIVSRPALVTNNPEDAMRDAQMLIFMMPAACHQVYLEALAPHVQPGTIIVGLPGNPEFDSQVRHVLGEKAQQCTIMNFESSPWTCRTTEFGVKCEVTGIMDTLLGNVKVGLVSLNENRLLPRGLFYFILLASPKTNKQTNRKNVDRDTATAVASYSGPFISHKVNINDIL